MGDAGPGQGLSVALGLAAHREGRLDEAARAYDAVLLQQAFHADALHLRGVVAMQQDDLATAYQLISRALEQRPANAAFHSNFAMVCRRLGRLDEAVHHAQSAAVLNEQSPQIHRVLGQCLSEAGKIAEALAAYEQANGIDATHRPTIDAELDCLRALGLQERTLARIEALRLVGDDPLRLRKAHALAALGRRASAWAELQACDDRTSLLWHLNALKLHLDFGDEAAAIPHGQAALELKEQLGLSRTDERQLAAHTLSWPLKAPEFRPNDAENPDRNWVCFSLWGSNPKYTLNALRNAEGVPRFYPGWRACFFLDDSVPCDIRDQLLALGAKLIRVADHEPRHVLKAFWRFFASEHPGLERFICRDCDALVNEREAAAVVEWIESGYLFHAMRDHAEHAELLMAGMWGGVAGLLPGLQAQALQYYQTYTPRWHWMDQDFLRDCVWPLIRQRCLVHDDRYRVGVHTRPFPPVHLPPGSHVGGYRPDLVG